MRSFIFLIACLFFIQLPTEAQLDKWKSKLEEKINKKKKKKKKKKPLFDLGKIMGSSDMELEESYDYDFTINWDVHSKDGDMFMKQLFATDKKYFGMEVEPKEQDGEVEKVDAVIDFERNYLIVLNPEDYKAIVTEFENIEDQTAKEASESSDKSFSIEKTTATKMIAGYSCTKYLYKGDDGKGEVWITTDLNYENLDLFSYFKKLNQQNNVEENSVWNNGIEGFILAIDGTDAEGNQFDMTATEVNKNASVSYKMEDYQVVDLTGLSKGLGGFNNVKN